MVHALFAGTFDPPTLGHLDVALRAAELFEKLTIGVAVHPTKEPIFDVDERLALLRELTSDCPGTRVREISGLVVEAARGLGASVLIRGVRHANDFTYETEMAGTNRVMAPEIQTVMLPAEPAHAFITASLVRQVASMGGDVSKLVPEAVGAALARRFG